MSTLGGFCEDSFWDSSLTWGGTWPQFTHCFQDTALVWIPCGFLWLSAPFYTWYLATSPIMASRNTYSKKYLIKLNLSLLLIILSAIQLFNAYTNSSSLRHDISIITAKALLTITMVLSLAFIIAERRKRFVTSGILFVFWLLLLICSIVPFYSNIEQQVYNDDVFNFAIFYIRFAFLLFQFIIHCFAEDPVRSIRVEKRPNPESESSFLSRLCFSWLTSLVIEGYKRPLVESSMPDLNPRDKSENVVPSFLSKWTKAVTRDKIRREIEMELEEESGSSESTPLLRGETNATPSYTRGDDGEASSSARKEKKQRRGPSLIWHLIRTFGWKYLSFQVWKLFYDALHLSNPLLLGELVAFISDPNDSSWRGYILALALFGSSTLQTVMFHQAFHQLCCMGLRVRASLISAIHRKSLTMNSASVEQSNSGEVVNLVSVDVDNIQEFFQYSWAVWSCPLQIAIALYLLYNRVGLAVFAGAGFLVLLIPVNGFLTALMSKFQEKLLLFKDERMKVMNELLSGCKIIKFFAWEKSFEKRVVAIRDKELSILYKFALLGAVFRFSWAVAPNLVSLLTFLTFVYMKDDHYLDPQTAFVALSLFEIIKFAINFAPMVITEGVKATISAKRIERYLCHDDLDESSVTQNDDADHPIEIINGVFRWNTEKRRATLKNINVVIPDQSLVAVVGPVGAGKSSLMSAMLGEINKMDGTVTVRGSMSYVPQQAWIQNDTLRNNILFGKEYDPVWYTQCIQACALESDLEMLPDSDLTEIGEKGINLSGGQKQRVSLARAVYSQSDIYLLDDPLSAVDSHVGRHIFNNILCGTGLLAGKVRVLVTHGLHWLPHTDHIIVITNGQVTESGHYEKLLSRNGDFAQLVTNYLLQSDDERVDSNNDEIQELKRRVLRTLSETAQDDSDGGRSLLDRPEEVIRQLSQTFDRSELTKKEEDKQQEDKQQKDKQQKDKPKTPAQTDGKLIEEENVMTGTVKWAVVKAYGRSVGYCYILLIIAFYLICAGCGVGSNLWLTEWTDDEGLANFTEIPANSSSRMDKNDYYMMIYGVFTIILTFATVASAVIESIRTVHASRVLHQSMLARILHAPMAFFDTTPIGRIVNRFSKDLNDVDEELPMTFNMWLDGVLIVVSSMVVISYSTPIFVVFLLPLGLIYSFSQRFYVATSRQLKRLSAKTKSPIFNHFSETLSGAPIIRAFGAQFRFVQESDDRVDSYQNFAYYSLGCNRWLGLRLDLVGNLVILSATMIAVATRDSVSAGIMGLLINSALQVTEELNWMVRMTSDLETQIVSVERIQEYSEIEIEAPWSKFDDSRHLPWPHQGVIEFDHFALRYRPGLELVLKDVSFTIRSREKIGIVGRTGAGKSSLTLALFRLMEPAGGRILIDGVDIATLGLHKLRSNITILPQDPVIFSGTLRQNLDPFEEYNEEALMMSIKHCHLAEFVDSLPDKLDYQCGEGGEKLSYGQRQLLCLGRALLRKSRILVLDEATAAVDMETDELLQKTIREEFRDCTILTIAHRLNTVMDYDRILVLDKGEVNDIDSPTNLLQKTDGLFYSMAKTANLIG